MMKMRIKCPNCGSTSQPELVWEDRDSYGTKKVKEYKYKETKGNEINEKGK